MSDTRVILGTAHGSNVAGKRSPDGVLREYRWSREMCARIKAALTAKGIDAVIDIEGEKESGLNARVRLVNKMVRDSGKPCIYVSVHINAAPGSGWSSARGWGAYIGQNASSNSKRLATLLHDKAMAAGLRGNRSIPSTKYHVQSLAVCRDTTCPAVLTENMFQNNHDDVAFLMSEHGKQVICDVHTEAICEYLGL